MATDGQTIGDADPDEARDQCAERPEEGTGSSERETVPSLWRNRTYVQWLVSDTTLLLGSTLRGTCITLLAYALSHSLALSSLLVSGGGIVALVLSLFGGTFIDRHPRKRLVILDAALNILIWGAVTVLLVMGRLTFPLFVVGYLAVEVVSGLMGSATNALLRSIVPAKLYPKASSFNTGRDSAVSIIGDPLGGAMYGAAVWLPFLASVVCNGLALLAASAIDVDESSIGAKSPQRGKANPVKDFAHDFIEGWRWFLSTKRMPLLVVMLCFQNFATVGISRGATLYLVSVHTSAFMIGVFNAAQSVFVIFGAMIASYWSVRARIGRVMVLTGALSFVICVPLVFFHSYAAILVLFCLWVLVFPLLNAATDGFIFAKVPKEMQGRANVCIGVPGSILADLGGALIGWLIERIGYGPSIALYLIPLAVGFVITLAPRLRSIPAADHWDDTEI